MDFRKLKTKYDNYNNSVYSNRAELISSQVRFTIDENNNLCYHSLYPFEIIKGN